jgi:hypothetical protein
MKNKNTYFLNIILQGRICEVRDNKKAISLIVSLIEGFGGVGKILNYFTITKFQS